MKFSRSTNGPLVGRSRPLEELQAVVRAAESGRGAIAFLSGEPGIGKTRLAEEVVAGDLGVRVAWGRCHEIKGRPPFWPWIQAMQSCSRSIGAEALAAMVPPDTVPLARMVPELHELLPAAADAQLPLDSEAARFRLFQGMIALLRRIATERALLLVLDDLHWADEPSLLLLEFLAYELPEAPIGVIGTFRDVEVRQSPAHSEIFGRILRRSANIPLVGLSVEEVAEFVAAACGETVGVEVAARLRSATEGNPFFLDEIVRLAREGRTGLGDSAPAARLSQGVRGTIQARLAPLSSATRRLLQVAAVAGREFDLAVLAEVLEQPRPTLLPLLAPAIEIEIVRPIGDRSGCYRFSHALVNETLRDDLSTSERAAWHLRFAETLDRDPTARDGAGLSEIAHHYFEASVLGHEATALHYSELAGGEAMRLFAFEEAAAHFRRALHLADRVPEFDERRRCGLLLLFGEAQNRAGDGDASRQTFHTAAALARRCGHPALLARAAIGLCGVVTGWTEFGRSDETLVGILHEALAQLPADELSLRARVLSRLATESYWARPVVDTQSLSAEAVALARQSGDRATLGYTLIGRLHCLAEPALVNERTRIIDELLELSAGEGELALHAHLWRFGDLQQQSRMRDARACGERLASAVEASRRPGDQWLASAVRAQRALLEGRLDAADDAVATILAQRMRKANAEQAALALLFLVRREQGRQAELAEGMRAFAYDSPPDVGVWRASLALLYAETGSLNEAHAELEALSGERLETMQRDNGWTLALASLAITCSRCGSAEQAARIQRHLLPFAEENVAGGPFCFMGPVAYYLGLLEARQGRHADALRHYDVALRAAREADAHPTVCRIILAQADSLEQQGGAGIHQAAELRRRAEATAADLKLGGILNTLAPGAKSAVGAQRPDAPTLAVLRQDAGGWSLAYRERVSRLKGLRGLQHLARLLQAPGEEAHVLELMTPSIPNRAASRAVGADLGPLLDGRAKRELRTRMRELQQEVEEADRDGDLGRAERLRDEIDAIEAAVLRAIGRGGRDRPNAAASERARAAVTKAIRAAVAEIARHEPELADLLGRTVKTGGFCSYVPLASAGVRWDVETNERSAQRDA